MMTEETERPSRILWRLGSAGMNRTLKEPGLPDKLSLPEPLKEKL
jgi:hypothetical protein